MIGLDTNILVRFLVQDDPKQADMANSLISRCSTRQPGFIGREALVEMVWVLERAYGQSAAAIAATLFGFLESEELVLENAEDVAVAAEAYGSGVADFADHMILAATQRSGCTTLYTFDRKAARANGATLLVK
ncbi:PIN domain-containing protein [Amaricoccus tamworthensis]|uniref:PIN domain-containing protein n=1 Tax=Amaricoccus tamworthensis TaxID=57002 RepID=UPI003C7C1FF2